MNHLGVVAVPHSRERSAPLVGTVTTAGFQTRRCPPNRPVWPKRIDMCDTYIYMAARSAPSTLDALDDALIAVRRVMQRAGYRRRLLADLDGRLEFGVLRALRAVERNGASAPCVGDIAETLAVDPPPRAGPSIAVSRWIC